MQCVRLVVVACVWALTSAMGVPVFPDSGAKVLARLMNRVPGLAVAVGPGHPASNVTVQRNNSWWYAATLRHPVPAAWRWRTLHPPFATHSPDHVLMGLLLTLAVENVIHAGSPASSSVVLEVGTGLGLFGYMGAALGALAIAFEAQPSCVSRMIVPTWALNPQWHQHMMVFSNAVSNRTAPVKIFGSSLKSGCNSMARMHSPRRSSEQRQVTQTMSIDMMLLMQVLGRTVHFVTVDVEGAELRVLEALLPALQARQVLNVVVELNVAFVTKAGARIQGWGYAETVDTFTAVQQAGYRAYMLQRNYDPRRDLPSAIARNLSSVTGHSFLQCPQLGTAIIGPVADYPTLVAKRKLSTHNLWLTVDQTLEQSVGKT